jgi:hypothetical protein
VALEGGPWLTLREAACRHGIPVNRLQMASKEGRLPTVRAGHNRWVKVADVVAYLERVRPWHQGKRSGRPRTRQPSPNNAPSRLQ